MQENYRKFWQIFVEESGTEVTLAHERLFQSSARGSSGFSFANSHKISFEGEPRS